MPNADDELDDELVANFQAITHASDENTTMYLRAADGDLQNAIEMFFAGMFHFVAIEFQRRQHLCGNGKKSSS